MGRAALLNARAVFLEAKKAMVNAFVFA